MDELIKQVIEAFELASYNDHISGISYTKKDNYARINVSYRAIDLYLVDQSPKIQQLLSEYKARNNYGRCILLCVNMTRDRSEIIDTRMMELGYLFERLRSWMNLDLRQLKIPINCNIQVSLVTHKYYEYDIVINLTQY